MANIDRRTRQPTEPQPMDGFRVAWEGTARGRIQRALMSFPLLGPAFLRLHARLNRTNVYDYWESRYRRGGDSGSGSYGRLAEFKADVLNRFVRERAIRSIVEFGCGDGHQLKLAEYPDYVGVDISETALLRCREAFASRPSMRFLPAGSPDIPHADCTLSLDVILHLTDNHSFESYMRELFAKSTRYVVIYSSNFEERYAAPHVRHRRFTEWIAREQPDFVLESQVANPYQSKLGGNDTSNANFFIYRRRDA